MSTLLSNFSTRYQSQSGLASDVGRQIVYELLVIAWGLSYTSEKGVKMDIFVFPCFLFLIGYLTFDLVQYFICAYKYKRLFTVLKQHIGEGIKTEEEISNIKAVGLEKISNLSYKYFITKYCLLPFGVVGLILHVVKRVLLDGI